MERWMEQGARVLRADRGQLRWDMVDLDSQLPLDHLARVIWAFCVTLDLKELYARIKARDDVAGRPTPDPRVLLALWLYATIEGVGSARALERLVESHAAYRWLAGGVPVNYHGLSDFRVAAGDVLDRLLSESVASLMAEGLVSLDEVAVDGTKLEANAGKGSLRDAAGIARFEARARARIERLKGELEADPGASERRRRQAQERAQSEIAARACAAREKLLQLQAEKAEREKRYKKAEAKKREPKASTTDPEARLMKMADGSFKLAYNLMLAAVPDKQIIVGLSLSDRRNEAGLATPMLDDVWRRFQKKPGRLLVDTKLATAEEIVALAEAEAVSIVYSPPPPDRQGAKPQSVAKREKRRQVEPEALKAWRERMASLEGQFVYARRKLIETVNGRLKNGNWRRFMLRGLLKARCEALLHAIAHNLRRGHALRLAAAQAQAQAAAQAAAT